MVKQLDKALSVIEVWAMVSLTLTGLLFAFTQVVLRYVFNAGVHWLEGALVTSLVWAMLFGAVRAVREGYHPRVDILPQLVSPRVRAVLNFLATSTAFCLGFFIFWDAIFYAKFLNMINALHPELGIKQLYPFLIVPIITLLMSLRYGLLLYTLFSEPDAASPDALFRQTMGENSNKGVEG